MARLVKYMVAAEGKLDPRSWTRTADYMLCSGTSSRGEKVGGVRVTNCHTNDPAAATTLIECTQAANTRSKTDKTYHLVFSFPPGEVPSLETLHKIEDELVASIGYADHQRISAVHIDTDHLHVHVAINKVRKIGKNYNNIEPFYDKKKLMETCERLEIEHGLTRTNHGLDGREPQAKVKPKQAQAEAHGGIETLTGLVTREIAPLLKEAKTWKEAHAILAEHGLEIKQRGAGLVIGSGNLWVKASQCDRALSFKGMTDRLGPFEKGLEPAKPYEPKPRQQHPSSAILFEQYQSEKLRAQLVREKGLALLQYETDLRDHYLQKMRVTQTLAIKIAPKGRARGAALKLANSHIAALRRKNWAEGATRRQELLSTTRTPGWQGWLAQQAEDGNTEALEVLRSRQERERMQGDYVTGNNPAHVLFPNTKPAIDRKGAITYTTSDGGVVIDRNNHVQCYRTSAKSQQMALDLAAQRFKGQTLIVEGQESFQKEVARLAAKHGIAVRIKSTAKQPINEVEI